MDRDGFAVKTPYSEEKDIVFYEDPAVDGSVLLQAGEYVVLAPEDAHKPRCAAGECAPVKKIVLKVPV